MALLPIKSCGAMIASKACSTEAFDAFSRSMIVLTSCGAMIASKACSTVAFDAFSRRMIVLTKLVNACSKDETLICALSWKERLKQLSERDENSRIENVNFYKVILVALK